MKTRIFATQRPGDSVGERIRSRANQQRFGTQPCNIEQAILDEIRTKYAGSGECRKKQREYPQYEAGREPRECTEARGPLPVNTQNNQRHELRRRRK